MKPRCGIEFIVPGAEHALTAVEVAGEHEPISRSHRGGEDTGKVGAQDSWSLRRRGPEDAVDPHRTVNGAVGEPTAAPRHYGSARS
jgi:hypothetical protein